MPWYAKAVVVLVAAWAFGHMDLIAGFIPVLGYLDDVVILPRGIAVATRLIRADVRLGCVARGRAF